MGIKILLLFSLFLNKIGSNTSVIFFTDHMLIKTWMSSYCEKRDLEHQRWKASVGLKFRPLVNNTVSTLLNGVPDKYEEDIPSLWIPQMTNAWYTVDRKLHIRTNTQIFLKER